MQFALNFKSGKPVYLQLADQVKAAAMAALLLSVPIDSSAADPPGQPISFIADWRSLIASSGLVWATAAAETTPAIASAAIASFFIDAP